MKPIKLLSIVLSLSLLPFSLAYAGKDLDAVRQKGFIQAGANGGVFGFGMPDAKGVLSLIHI